MFDCCHNCLWHALIECLDSKMQSVVSTVLGLGQGITPLQYGWMMFRVVVLRALLIRATSVAGEDTTVGTMKMWVWFVATVSSTKLYSMTSFVR